jgi:hypothetical protein
MSGEQAIRLEGIEMFEGTAGGYAEAERFADEWAGDNCAYAAVVEDHDMNDRLAVMDGLTAEAWQASDEINADIIYRADHRPVRP